MAFAKHPLPLAWGKIGDCHLQLATLFPGSYSDATNAYQKVIDSKRADVPIAARNQAEVGIATTLERLAEIRPKERTELLKAAIQKTQFPLTLKCLENNIKAVEFYNNTGFIEKEKGRSENGTYILFELSKDIN